MCQGTQPMADFNPADRRAAAEVAVSMEISSSVGSAEIRRHAESCHGDKYAAAGGAYIETPVTLDTSSCLRDSSVRKEPGRRAGPLQLFPAKAVRHSRTISS